jgi:hypothetical protein
VNRLPFASGPTVQDIRAWAVEHILANYGRLDSIDSREAAASIVAAADVLSEYVQRGLPAAPTQPPASLGNWPESTVSARAAA